MKTINRILRGEKGFTLIELLAVMSIVATLAGIVSTSVSGSNEASKIAAAQKDASTTKSAAASYFADHEAAEVLVARTVTVTALFDNEEAGDVAATEQKSCGRWPETNITEGFDSIQVLGETLTTTPYFNESPTSNAATNGIVVHVNILGEEDAAGNREAISRSDLLTGYTAVDFDRLVSDGTDTNQGGYSEKVPSSATEVTEADGMEFHNFLWLFKKTTSAGGSGDNDSRLISIFKLERVDATKVEALDLTYAQIY